jgi:hypothetical protein
MPALDTLTGRLTDRLQALRDEKQRVRTQQQLELDRLNAEIDATLAALAALAADPAAANVFEALAAADVKVRVGQVV